MEYSIFLLCCKLNAKARTALKERSQKRLEPTTTNVPTAANGATVARSCDGQNADGYASAKAERPPTVQDPKTPPNRHPTLQILTDAIREFYGSSCR